jgi:hypothetical protein
LVIIVWSYEQKQEAGAINANPKKATKPLLSSLKDGTTSFHKKTNQQSSYNEDERKG